MIWILIAGVVGKTFLSQEFNSEAACNTAKDDFYKYHIQRDIGYIPNAVIAKCYPKG